MPQHRLFIKITLIACLLIAFAVGLSFVKIVVSERQNYHQQVMLDISKHQISTQKIISPFITVPYVYQQACNAEPNPELKGKTCNYIAEELFFPEQSSWDGTFNVTNQEYQRTIYHAISYISKLDNQGEFKAIQNTSRAYQWEKAKFVLPVKDLRGIQNKPILTVNEQKLTLDFPKDKNQNSEFNYLEVAIPHLTTASFNYTLNLELEGLQDFSLIPTTENLQFNAQGNWGDIKFKGDGLPQQNHAATKKFNASWSSITLGYQNQQSLIQCWATDSCKDMFNFASTAYKDHSYSSYNISGFEIEFIEPINIYSQTDRAVKYGWMMTLITFGSFFLFEMIKGLRIHPIQYGLVGTAQSIFFILLLSLSEQISFITAYGIASIACIGLISWYLSFILKSWRSTALFSVLISSLYGVMYMLLQSAEKTFLMGSLFSFFIVAAVMYLTRHIDWYDIGDQFTSPNSKTKEIKNADLNHD